MIYGVGCDRGARATPPCGARGTAGDAARDLLEASGPVAEGPRRVSRIRAGQDLGGAFAGVADELHTQYLLGFSPPRRDGKVHDVSVRVTPGGLKPRARKSYVAPKS